jgi:hypothetical protein
VSIALFARITNQSVDKRSSLFGDEFFAGAVEVGLFAVGFVEGADGARDVVDEFDVDGRAIGRSVGLFGWEHDAEGEKARAAAFGEFLGFGQELGADFCELAAGGELVGFGEGAIDFGLTS